MDIPEDRKNQDNTADMVSVDILEDIDFLDNSSDKGFSDILQGRFALGSNLGME